MIVINEPTKEERRRALKRGLTIPATSALGLAPYLIGRKAGIKGLNNPLVGIAGGIGGALIGKRLVRKGDMDHLRRKGMTDLKSSMIRGVRHEPEGSYIKFNTGNVYRYDDMKRHELEELANAESAGKFFNQHLKNRHYERMGKL
tara:strand:- start:58 stop:492 length:435 start_codon:yes stop_codon:yes gene_type:complete